MKTTVRGIAGEREHVVREERNASLRCWMGGLSIVLTVVLLFSVVAAAEERTKQTVMRVGFPIVAGYTEYGENGKHQGLVVDFLNEIAKYTGWKYEYVPTSDALADFQAGKFDLMGRAFYVTDESLPVAYPKYSCGYTKAMLMARKADTSIQSYNLNTLDGKTIGVYDRSVEDIEHLKQWLKDKKLNCKICTYNYDTLSMTGGLYARLQSREVDMLLSYNVNIPHDIYAVTSFESQLYYIVTTSQNQEVLGGLNMALEKIYAADTNFAKKVYEKNFESNFIGYASLSPEEQAYVTKKGTVTVAVPTYWHPLFCVGIDDYHEGFVQDMLKKVKVFSGLTFVYVTCGSYIEALTLVQEGRADMLGFFMGSDEEAARYDLACTEPYVSAAAILVRNKNVTYPSEGRICGILSGRKFPTGIAAEKMLYYACAEEGLNDVNSGKIDFFYGTSSHLENIIRQKNLSNVVQVSLPNRSIDIGFAVPSPVDSPLFSILNKTVTNMTQAEKETLSSLNMVSIGDTQITLSGIMAANPMLAVITGLSFLLMGLLFVALIFHFRLRSAKMQLGLEKAEAGSRAKSDFLSRMSHEIRTPMNAIVGLTDLTEQLPGLPEKARSNLDKVKSSSRYLLSLINDILDMSRIESGKMTLCCTPFSMNELLSAIESMLASGAERRGITFRVESNVREESYVGDNVRLRQVILNLLSNAFKFTPEGGSVVLRISGAPASQSGQALTIQVMDTGVGISPENQEKAFQCFEQFGNNISKSQGTGLGLPICRSIVHLMGGELLLESELGKGSTFYFTITLPVAPCSQSEQKTVEEQSLHGTRILLAEDNDLNAEIAIELLRIQGVEVRRAENGAQAVEMFETSALGDFQAILMDLQMPVMNGLEATVAIRALNRPDARTIPIIAMTANSFQEDVDASEAVGMSGFVPKPVDVDMLYRELRKAVQSSVEQ